MDDNIVSDEWLDAPDCEHDVQGLCPTCETDHAIRQVLAGHTPVDTSGGSDTEGNTIFCGGHQWHLECTGWQEWIDHVAPLLHDAVTRGFYS